MLNAASDCLPAGFCRLRQKFSNGARREAGIQFCVPRFAFGVLRSAFSVFLNNFFLFFCPDVIVLQRLNQEIK